VSVISRVVVHPKYRSIGLGERLVKETLALAGTPNVEAVAVMAKYNPFFEKAGMTRIAESKPNPHITKALAGLEALGFQTPLLASTSLTMQKIEATGTQPVIDVLIELSLHCSNIRRKLASSQKVYQSHEEFVQKINSYSHEQLGEALKKLAFSNQTKTYLHWKKTLF
jgi:ABC-type ATPase with predicted acetyltransferase domain